MGIPNNEIENIANQYLEEVEEAPELELGEFWSEGWMINDKEMAMKVDRAIYYIEESIAADEDICNKQKEPLLLKIEKLNEGIAKLDEWLDRSTKAQRSRIQDLKTHLHLYHQRVIDAEIEENKQLIAQNKKPRKLSKTIKLTYRDLTSKAQLPTITKDEGKLLEWVEETYNTGISCNKILQLLETKGEDDFFTVKEVLEFLKSYQTEFVSREPKLAWGEYKKSLTIEEKSDGKKFYMDEFGQEVQHVTLEERGDVYDWKLLKE